jgi:threonine/homoserine/homoserine lactone efflux protein
MDLVLFLSIIAFISLTGVLMPGPVFAAAVAKGTESRHAGAWIALGHMLVEVPLIIAIASGFYYILTNDWIRGGIGIIGGGLLFFMGARMVQMKGESDVAEKAFPYHPFVAGVLTTGTNPYFLLWWATVGASMIILALGFGLGGLLLFIIVHESCDLGWDWLVSYSVNRSKNIWTPKTQSYVFGCCGLLLMLFGVYFVLSFIL